MYYGEHGVFGFVGEGGESGWQRDQERPGRDFFSTPAISDA